MKASKLNSIIRSNLPDARLRITDGSYSAPRIEWMLDSFYKKLFHKWVKKNKMDMWRQYWDCDNFAMLYFTFAQICHANTQLLNEKKGKSGMTQGLTVGVMFYEIGGDPKKAHAINFVIDKDNIFHAIEPQTGKKLPLTKKEKASCWFALV
jgi:hypothetical protein